MVASGARWSSSCCSRVARSSVDVEPGPAHEPSWASRTSPAAWPRIVDAQRSARSCVVRGIVTSLTTSTLRSGCATPPSRCLSASDEATGHLKQTERGWGWPVALRRMSQFVDECQLNVRGGDGGAGCVAFRREGPVVMGGPNGGDGGKGGDVWLVADHNVASLLAFRDHPHRRADDGVHGKGKDLHGKRGASIEIKVPEGTVVSDLYSGERARRAAPPRRSLAGGRRWAGRAGQRQVPVEQAPGAELRRAGRARRGPLAQARDAADGRRRPRRVPERRQEHADQRHLGGPAEDRRLPVHDARTEPRRRARRRDDRVRRRRHPRADRGRQRGQGPRPPVPAARRAGPRAVPDARPDPDRRRLARPSRNGSCCASSAPTNRSCSSVPASSSARRPMRCRPTSCARRAGTVR